MVEKHSVEFCSCSHLCQIVYTVLPPTPTPTPTHAHTHTHRHGAVSVEDEQREREKQKSASFLGSGFKLGDSEGPSVQITGRQVEQPTEKVWLYHSLFVASNIHCI